MAMTKRLAHVLVRDSLVSSVNLIGTNQFERSGRWQARAWASVDRPANPIAFIFRHYVVVCLTYFRCSVKKAVSLSNGISCTRS
jgi:hypothetical protein